MKLQKVNYDNLNARQQENYNFQKVAAVLADYGFSCMWLNDDWQGADFIACHIDGETFLKVQLKGRLSVDKKYLRKNIHIAIPAGDKWYLYPHDQTVEQLIAHGYLAETVSWTKHGHYNWSNIPSTIQSLLKDYRI